MPWYDELELISIVVDPSVWAAESGKVRSPTPKFRPLLATILCLVFDSQGIDTTQIINRNGTSFNSLENYLYFGGNTHHQDQDLLIPVWHCGNELNITVLVGSNGVFADLGVIFAVWAVQFWRTFAIFIRIWHRPICSQYTDQPHGRARVTKLLSAGGAIWLFFHWLFKGGPQS